MIFFFFNRKRIIKGVQSNVWDLEENGLSVILLPPKADFRGSAHVTILNVIWKIGSSRSDFSSLHR